MLSKIRVAILDDHQSIIDGFTYRLSMDPDIQIVSKALYGEDLEPMIANNPVDVLLLDVSVPNSPEDHNSYPVLHTIPSLLKEYPGLNILVNVKNLKDPAPAAELLTGLHEQERLAVSLEQKVKGIVETRAEIKLG